MGRSKELPRRQEVNAGYPVGSPGEFGLAQAALLPPWPPQEKCGGKENPKPVSRHRKMLGTEAVIEVTEWDCEGAENLDSQALPSENFSLKDVHN